MDGNIMMLEAPLRIECILIPVSILFSVLELLPPTKRYNITGTCKLVAVLKKKEKA